MLKAVLVATTAFAIAGSTLVFAQQPSPGPDRPHAMPSREDIGAYADARIAALKAGLRLTPEQEKSWPAFESALRDLAKVRGEHRAERREARLERRSDDAKPRNPAERMRKRADAMTATGAAFKRVADAMEPFYATLDDGQKRRFHVLARMLRPHRHFAGHHRHHMRGMGGWGDHDGMRGPGRHRGGDFRGPDATPDEPQGEKL